MNLQRMAEQLVLHEGLRTHAYLDTEDNWTVGVGYNLSARGTDALEKICGRKFSGPLSGVILTEPEALNVLRADIERVHHVIPLHFPEYAQLDEIRQRVVLDMAFNMGFGALGFKNAKDAIIKRNWSQAARELYKSKWARQVGDGPGGKYDRCDRLTQMLLTGKDFTH